MKWPELPGVSAITSLIVLGLAGLFVSILAYSLALAGIVVSTIVLCIGLVGAFRER